LSANGQHYGFFVEPVSEQHEPGQYERDREPGRPELAWIEVPSSDVCYLATEPGKPPQVLSKAPVSKARVSVLETVRYERQTYLMMLPSDGVRLNGLPMPPVAILRVGDRLRVDGEWLLHVSRFTRPCVGPPPKEYLDKPCSYCRMKFTPATITYVCPNCGTPVHCESEDNPSDKEIGPLECARLIRECHHCKQPIVLKERHEYVPEC